MFDLDVGLRLMAQSQDVSAPARPSPDLASLQGYDPDSGLYLCRQGGGTVGLAAPLRPTTAPVGRVAWYSQGRVDY